MMMTAFKIVRAAGNPSHKDNWVNMSGYSTFGAERMDSKKEALEDVIDKKQQDEQADKVNVPPCVVTTDDIKTEDQTKLSSLVKQMDAERKAHQTHQDAPGETIRPEEDNNLVGWSRRPQEKDGKE